jgi:hypothetical protein
MPDSSTAFPPNPHGSPPLPAIRRADSEHRTRYDEKSRYSRLLLLRHGKTQKAGRVEAKSEVYDAYRKQIEHEDELIGMRNGWLIGGQAFLFAAYAATLAVQSHGAQRGFASAAHQLFVELPVVGTALAALVFLTVNAALCRSGQLRKRFDNLHETPQNYPSIMSIIPRWIGHGVARLIPILFVGSWIGVIWFR